LALAVLAVPQRVLLEPGAARRSQLSQEKKPMTITHNELSPEAKLSAYLLIAVGHIGDASDPALEAHPGAQLDMVEQRDGWRYTAFAATTAGGQLAQLDCRVRRGRRPHPAP
jgi:hypothetical protein